ncbi:unnamed protein product [Ixodes pacificus]
MLSRCNRTQYVVTIITLYMRWVPPTSFSSPERKAVNVVLAPNRPRARAAPYIRWTSPGFLFLYGYGH